MLLTIDFETYYDKDYSLTKLTTEEYIRSPFFEIIGVGVKLDDKEPQWASGTHEEIKSWLLQFDWASNSALAHNAAFDGAILNWVFGIRPKAWLDTLSMARYLHGVDVGGSLKALAERYKLGVKGEEVLAAIGHRRADFTPEGLAAYGDYCLNDVNLTYKLLLAMGVQVPPVERKAIDITVRMFTEPMLRLDLPLLEEHLEDVRRRKQVLLDKAGAMTEDLMSNDKFAALLRAEGVVPPTKISPATGKETLAMAKTDPDFLALTEHPNERVQALMAARLGAKSTLEETRTETMIAIARRGPMPVPLKYFAAHTGRWGGADNMNLQNLPRVGEDAGKLKSAILPPPGYVLIDSDSSQIEARVLAWLAGQEDLVQGFADKKRDVYKAMAAKVYGVPESEVTAPQRQLGKVAVLGAGYGMGAEKFQLTLQSRGIEASIDLCRTTIQAYRETYPAIVRFWREANFNLRSLMDGVDGFFSARNLKIVGRHYAIRLPDGRLLRYPGLKLLEDGTYVYVRKNKEYKIYGGKVVENICQAVARSVIAEQMVRLARQYRVLLTVHDSLVCAVPEAEKEAAVQYVSDTMKWSPPWATGLFLGCTVHVGDRYGTYE